MWGKCYIQLKPEYMQQKQDWLATEKARWFNTRRDDWGARGKPTLWAEWRALWEYEWSVNGLPSRELRWARQPTGEAGIVNS